MSKDEENNEQTNTIISDTNKCNEKTKIMDVALQQETGYFGKGGQTKPLRGLIRSTKQRSYNSLHLSPSELELAISVICIEGQL